MPLHSRTPVRPGLQVDAVEAARGGIHRGFTAVSFAGPGARRSGSHQADEKGVIVLSGQLDVGVDGGVRHLTTGDALLPDPRHPHSYVNPGPGPTTTPWS